MQLDLVGECRAPTCGALEDKVADSGAYASRRCSSVMANNHRGQPALYLAGLLIKILEIRLQVRVPRWTLTLPAQTNRLLFGMAGRAAVLRLWAGPA